MKRLAAILVSAGLLSFAHNQAQAACGTVDVAKGDVKIQSGQTKKVEAAKVGSKICSGDAIIAAKDSRAKLKMEDGNELNISPESTIVLENYQFNPAENKKKVLLNVLKGKVRAATQRENMYNDKASDGQANTFQVKTKSAVAGVRGTDFLTGFDPKTNKSEVVTFKGQVEVGQMGPGGAILNPVQVMAGQYTYTVLGQPPAPPVTVSPREMEKQNSESTVTSTAPSSAPAAVGTAQTESSTDATKNESAQPEPKQQVATGDKSSSASPSEPSKAPSASTGGGRAPATAGSGAMLTDQDLKGGTTFSNTPTTPNTPGGGALPAGIVGAKVPIVAPTGPTIPQVPACDFCQRTIQTGIVTPGKVNVRIGY